MPKPYTTFATIGQLGLFSLPFLAWQHVLPLSAFAAEWLAAAFGLLTMTILLDRRAFAPLELPSTLVWPLTILVLLVVQMSMGMVIYSGQGRLAMLYLLLSMLMMITTRALSKEFGPGRLSHWLAWATLAGGLTNGLIAVVQWQDIHTVFDRFIVDPPGRQAYGNLAQANHFAVHQALALAALIFLYASGRLGLSMTLASGSVLMLGLTLPGSRSALLYLLLFLGIAILFHKQQRSTQSRIVLIAAAVLLPGFLLAQMGTLLADSHAPTAISRLATPESQVGTRALLWQAAWDMFLDAPILGGGYQNYAWHYFQGLLTLPTGVSNLHEHVYAENAHNIVLQLLAEFGIGAGIALMIFAYMLSRAYKQIESPERWMLLAMLATIGIHSLLEYPLHYMYFLAVASVLLALVFDNGFKAHHMQRIGPALSLLGLTIGCMLLAMLFVGNTALQNLYRTYESKNVMQAWRGGAIQANLATAQKMGFFEPMVDSFVIGLSVDVPDPDKIDLMLEISNRVMRQKTNAVNVYRHVLLLGLSGRHDESLQLLDKATRAYPSYRETFEKKLGELATANPEQQEVKQLRDALHI